MEEVKAPDIIKVHDIIKERIAIILDLITIDEKKFKEFYLRLEQNLEQKTIMFWLGQNLNKYLVSTVSVNKAEAKRIVAKLRRDIFPLIYAQEIENAKITMDIRYKNKIRTATQLLRVDRGLYKVSQSYLRKDGRMDLCLLSEAFGMTFHFSAIGTYSYSVEKIAQDLYYLSPRIITVILLSLSKSDKYNNIHDRFLGYRNLYQEKFLDYNGRRSIHSLACLSKTEKKSLHINICHELIVLSKAANIGIYELMRDYLKGVFEILILKEDREVSDLTDEVNLALRSLFLTLGEINQ